MDELAQVPDEIKHRSGNGSVITGESSRVKALVDATPSEQLQNHYRNDYQSLVNRSRRIVRSTETAEDIVQEAYSRTVSAIQQGTEIKEMGPYLNMCVRNLSLRHIKRKAMLPLNEDVSFARADSTDELVHRRQQYEAVCKAMSGLAPAQKSALYLAEIRGMAYSEIADSMHKPETAVRQLISRARTRVRETAGPRSLSIALPLLLLMDTETRRGLPFWIQVRVLITRTRYRALARLNRWQASESVILKGSANLVRQPAMAFLVGAMAISVLALSGSENGSSTQLAENGSSKAVFSDTDSRYTALAGQGNSASDPGSPGSSSGPLSPFITEEAMDDGITAGRDRNNSSGTEGTSRHGDSKGGSNSSPDPPDSGDSDSPGTTPAPGSDSGGGSSGGVVAPTNTASASFSGNAYVGQTLTASNGTWSNDPSSFSYQWLRGGASIAGATSSSYTLVVADAGNTVGVRVTATNAAGSTTNTSSTVAVIDVPAYTTQPTTIIMSGNPPAAGEVVFCSEGVWTFSPITIVRRLRRNGLMIVPSTFQYTLVPADIGTGQRFDCYVTSTNAAGTSAVVSDTLVT